MFEKGVEGERLHRGKILKYSNAYEFQSYGTLPYIEYLHRCKLLYAIYEQETKKYPFEDDNLTKHFKIWQDVFFTCGRFKGYDIANDRILYSELASPYTEPISRNSLDAFL